MGTPGPTAEVTLQDTMEVFTGLEPQCKPLTTREIADELECSRRTAYRKLDQLTSDGMLESKKVGASGRVWWRSIAADGLTGTEDIRVNPAEFDEFVRVVEDYAIFILNPEGDVASWNEGAARIKGYEEKEILGEHFSTFYSDNEIQQGVPTKNLEVAREQGQVEDEGWRVRKDGSKFWANVTITALYDDDGSIRGFTKVTRDLTERKRAKEKLERERELLDRIIEASPVAIATFSSEGKIMRANSRAAINLGISTEESDEYDVGEQTIYDTEGNPVSAEDRPFNRVLQSGEPIYDWECQIERVDGERRWFSVNAAPIVEDDGGIEHVVTTADDITELKEREHELSQERDQTEELLHTAPVSIAIQDADGEIIMANRRAQNVLNLTEREIIEEPDDIDDWNVYDNNGEPLAQDKTPSARVLATGEPVSDEVIGIEPPTGDRKWFSLNATPVFNHEGDINRVIVVGEDITKLKEQSHQLERQRDELQTELNEVFERVDDAFCALDKDWQFTHVNTGAEKFMQRAEADIIGESIWEVFPDTVDGSVWEYFHEAMETHESKTFESYFESFDRWLELSAYPSETGLSVYFRDITDRKEREHQLQRYERIVETVHDGVYTVDTNGRFTMVNNAYAEMTGYCPEDLIGEHVSIAVDEETIQTAREYEGELAAGDREVAKFEADVLTADGGTIRAEASFSLLPSRGDDYERVGVVRDVTDRVQWERELEQYKTIVETIDDGVYVIDDDYQITMMNEAFAQMIGRSRDELLGSQISEVIGTDATEINDQLSGALIGRGERSGNVEIDIETDDGGRITTEIRYTLLPFENEEFQGTVGVIRDITERKERERELEEQRERYRGLVDAAPVSIAIYDAEGDLLYVNNMGIGFIDATGPDDILGESAIQFVHSEDRMEAVERMKRVIEQRETVPPKETKIVTQDGSLKHAIITTVPITYNGKRAGQLVLTDITDRKDRERELKEYERIVETIDDGIYVLDSAGNFQQVNESFASMTQFDTEELIGLHASTVFGEKFNDLDEEAQRQFDIGETDIHTFEEDIYTVDDEEITVENRFTEIDVGNGMGRVGVIRDITDRKEYERELESRTRQQTMISELGQYALENPELDELFSEASNLVADVLDNDYCKVLDLDSDAEELLLCQGVGWRDGIVGDATVSAVESDSQAAYTLRSKEPVVVTDLEDETRFSGPDLLRSHDVTSGISTIIGSREDPWGILGTHDTDKKEFTNEDILFVQTVANILAEAIERQTYRDDLEELVNELEESNERLEQFAYIASHDLQEPLRMVSNYLQLIERRYADKLDDDGEEFIDFAVDGAERMRDMITDLLAYSRVDTQAEPLTLTDCNEVVNDVRRGLQVKIEEHDATIEVESLPTIPADKNQLEQLFQNLLSNAIKYRGDDPPRIEIGAERDDGEWTFRIADNGIGIDPNQTDQIFEVFKRLHTKKEYTGTGIGLALCKKIIDRHGGDIWAESEPGEGTTFYFTIPLRDYRRDQSTTAMKN